MTRTVPSSSVRSPLSPALRRSIVVVITGAVMVSLDSTIVNVALDSLSRRLDAPLAAVQWVVTAYLLALAAVIPASARLAERIGPGRLYVVALAIFSVGSGLCALSPSVTVLVACRVIQGIGGGLLLPLGAMIWGPLAEKQQMARVIAVVGLPMVLAPMLGPTIGGLLIQGFGWPAIFWLNVPVGAIGIVLALAVLPRSADGARSARGHLDFFGLALVAGGAAGLSYGLADIVNVRGLTVVTGAILLASVAALAGFVLWELRAPHPLLDLRLYRIPAFRAATVSLFCLGAAMFGGMILMPLYFQIVRGQSEIVTGLLLAPSGVGAAAASLAGARVIDRIGAGVTAMLGGLLSVGATVPFILIAADTPFVVLCAAMAVRGLGIGFSVMPVITAVYRAIPRQKIPDATPQTNLLQRFGGSLGVAVFTVLLTSGTVHGAGSAQAFGNTYFWVGLVTLVAVVPTLILVRAERAMGRNSSIGR